MITNATITIYNRQFDTGTKAATYRRHVVKEVSYYASLDVSAGGSGLIGGNVYKMRVPAEALVDGRPALDSYLTPAEYKESGGENNWTCENGDYFCIGEGPAVFTKPSEFESLHLQYGKIQSWGDNRRGGLPHIRIEGW